MERNLTLKEYGRLKEKCWISMPIDESRKYVLLQNGEEVLFSNEGTGNMLCQLVDEDDNYIKFIGEAKLEVELEGESYRKGAYFINDMCFKLYNMLQHGIMSYTLLKEEFGSISEEAKKQFRNKKCWIPSNDTLYTTYYGLGLQRVYVEGMHDYGMFSILSNTTSRKKYWICPMFLMSKENSNVKIKGAGSKEHPYRIYFVS